MLFQTGLANAYHFKSRHYIDIWNLEAKLTPPEFEDALSAAQRAYELEPGNPHYQLTLAKVMEWGAFAGIYQIDTSLSTSLYRQAIAQRPNWPNAYADYAYHLAFFRRDLAAAWPQLSLALDYGPFTPEVLRQVLVVGFNFWPELSAGQKLLVLQSAHKLVLANGRHYQLVNKLARQYRRSGALCSYLKNLSDPLPAAKLTQLNRDVCRA
ncbi:hypothetical protein [Shewanella salipaludis]|uniref:Uncharacterized protein n=1 Tax=Shewanella salipaludis TaxID=2723052 RepID=A0A972JJP8_9GAMM|nr:hypothetical protein [Shewanella salipaludis]NMH65375.1 hypothetical protein [Shewanella salipaludis]